MKRQMGDDLMVGQRLSAERSVSRLTGVLAGISAATVLGIFGAVVLDLLVPPDVVNPGSISPEGLLRALVFLFSTGFLPGLCALVIYPATLRRRSKGLSAALGREAFVIAAAGFTLWVWSALAGI